MKQNDSFDRVRVNQYMVTVVVIVKRDVERVELKTLGSKK